MNRWQKELQCLRDLVPPAGMVPQVEQEVMARLAPQRHSRAGLRRAAAVSLALAAAIMAFLVLRLTPSGKVVPEPQFVASTVIMDDHIYIWLEPVEGVSREAAK
jgi:hypothetical protein